MKDKNRKPITIKNTTVWKEIAKVSDKLKIPVYLVGGSVRDPLMGLASTDNDFLVLGPSKSFAEKAGQYLSGSKIVHFPKFDSTFFYFEDRKLEFSSPRVPDSGLSERDWITEDLKGRDFTINAIAAKLTGQDRLEIFDPLDGITDISEKNLRTPVDPRRTVSDDPIRIMRAFRFAAKFNLNIDPAMLKAMSESTEELGRISNERIGEELWKILELKKPSKALLPLHNIGALKIILPEVAYLEGVEKRGKFNHKNVLLHSFKVLDNVAATGGDTITRFTALVHDIAKPMTKRFDPVEGFTFHGHEDLGSKMVKSIAKRLRFSNDRIKLAGKLTLLHMRPVNLAGTIVSDSAIRRLMTQTGGDLDRLLALCRADITSGNPVKAKRYLANFDFMIQRMKEVEEKDEMRAFQSPVRGEEIMEICGLPPGPIIGKIKTAIEEAILEGIIPNDYDAAKEYFITHKDEWLSGKDE